MENEPHMQVDMYNRMPTLIDGPSSQLLSESNLRTSLFHPSNLENRMIGLPIEQSFKEMHSDKSMSFDDVSTRYNFNHQQMFLQEDVYASSSSVPSSVTHDYNNLISDVNNKWDHNYNRFLMHMEPVQFSEVQDTYETFRSQSELCLSLATTGPSFPCQESSQFSEMVSGSRYRAVLQQILSEVASYSVDSGNLLSSSLNVPFSSDHFGGDEFRDSNGSIEAHVGSLHRKQDPESKKSQLLSLLQVVDEQYNRCLDQMHTVISAFHAASDLDPQLHACFALQSVTFFYKNLRQRISNQILEMGTESSENGGDSSRRSCFEKCFIQKQWALQQSKKKDQQLWRPQRGLPERSVSVLRAWMFDNFLHPYPKDAEKHLLAVKSGLSRSQVSNWFINARVRLWKPLVEEMCSELTRRKSNRQIDEGSNNNIRNNKSNQLSIYDFNQILDA